MTLPKNPLEKPDFGDEISAEEVTEVMDSFRRSYELIEGSPEQEDGAFSERVTVPAGQELTFTVQPGNEKIFFLEEINISPTLKGIDYEIIADDTNTSASILPFGVPKVVRDKIRIKINNPASTEETFQIVGDARLVSEVRNR